MNKFISENCENFASKTVTSTDKNKGAFVLSDALRNVLSSAGYKPGHGGGNAQLLKLKVLDDSRINSLNVSYYDAIREGTGRRPETRMGRELVAWMNVGDNLTFGNIGETIFVSKQTDSILPFYKLAARIADDTDLNSLLAKARKATGKPSKQNKVVQDFRRSLVVVAGALARAKGVCEMPLCTRGHQQLPMDRSCNDSPAFLGHIHDAGLIQVLCGLSWEDEGLPKKIAPNL